MYVLLLSKLIIFRYDKYLAKYMAAMSIIGADIHVIVR